MVSSRVAPHRFHLRTVLLIPAVCLNFGAVGLVGWLSFANGQRAINDLARQLMDEVSARIEYRVEAYIETAQLINGLNEDGIRSGQLDLADLDALTTHFWQQMRRFPDVTFIYWADASGRFAGSVRQGDGELSIATAEEGYYTRYRVDDQGQPTQLMYDLTDYDPRERPFYRLPEQAGRLIWTPIFVWSSESTMSADPTVPLYDEAGQLLGVLGVSLGLPEISEFLRSLAIGQSGEAYIVERSGQIVATSAASAPFAVDETGKTAGRLEATESDSELIGASAEYLLQRFGDLGQIRQAIQGEFQIEGQRQFVQVVPFTNAQGLDWLIVVTVPQADFMARIHANTRNTMGLAAVALVITVVLSAVATRLITQPVTEIIEASQQMAAGKLDQQVVENSRIVELERLSETFNSMADQVKQAFASLEDRVRERTAELAQANQEISDLNEQLQADNLRLGAELNIAKQLQQMVLPKPEELESITGLDLAGFMEHADEVGGDYYDVLQTHGVVTLGIGDVTGHGLESGILMLMTQTAVRTLQELREQDPVRFLDTLNRAIYKNIQRMNSEKSITLALLNYTNGSLTISGQHEETLVVRVGGQIERIDTIDLGFPIGLDDPIADFVGRVQITLEPGDGIVLYTDGITEAENMEGKRYGIERLCEVISQNWSQTAAEVKDQVVADVKQFIGQQKIYDDITLLVLKRNIGEQDREKVLIGVDSSRMDLSQVTGKLA